MSPDEGVVVDDLFAVQIRVQPAPGVVTPFN